MMLKFIEEPEKNIIGFLITDNRENVIHTIKSRCEIVNAYYGQKNIVLSSAIEALVEDYLYNIEVEKEKSIVYNKDVLDSKLEREEMILFFKAILKIYLQLFQEEIIPEKLISLKNLSKEQVFKRISLVAECLERLNYNVNILLLLDDFVLRLED